MALNKITFQNKIALESSPAIDAMNKNCIGGVKYV